MQFNRMPQGFISASACWDQAMLDTFSPETLAEIKAELTAEEAAQLVNPLKNFSPFIRMIPGSSLTLRNCIYCILRLS